MSNAVECAICGRVHLISDSELAFGLPDVVFDLSEEQREERCRIEHELVVLDDDRFFLRGILPLNVSGRARKYSVGVWSEISWGTLKRILELWSDPNQDQEPRMPARLANKLPFHMNTVGLPLSIQLTGPKTRPAFFLEPTDHSLYIEQSRGIDEHRAIEYSDPGARTAAIEQALRADAGEQRPILPRR